MAGMAWGLYVEREAFLSIVDGWLLDNHNWHQTWPDHSREILRIKNDSKSEWVRLESADRIVVAFGQVQVFNDGRLTVWAKDAAGLRVWDGNDLSTKPVSRGYGYAPKRIPAQPLMAYFQARTEAGENLQVIADKLGLNQSAVWRVATNRQKWISESTARKMAGDDFGKIYPNGVANS